MNFSRNYLSKKALRNQEPKIRHVKYQNIDGWNHMNQCKVAAILTASNTLTVTFFSEIKAPMQDSTLNIHIEGYMTYYALRESSTGGMCALVCEN